MSVRLLLLGVALLAGSPALAGPAEDWLARINQAARALNYDGVFVYVHGGQVEAMRVVHVVGPDGVRERLVSLNGEAREVIRDDQQVWCYLPKKKMGVHEYRHDEAQGFPALLSGKADRLGRHYRLALMAEDRIAGRRAQGLRIQPRDRYRYGYRLWADVDTGLLLKVDLVDAGGEAVEQYMFTHLVLGDAVDPAALAPATPREALEWKGSADEHPPPTRSGGRWRAGRTPPGFELVSQVTRYLPMQEVPVEHLVYSDGIASVSVFVQKAGAGPPALEGVTRMGAVHAFGTRRDGYQITVVGEVPADTVALIGRSLQPAS